MYCPRIQQSEVTMNFDDRLIDLIRGKEFLYDRRDQNYRNNDLKELEWKKIAIDLDSTVERCKKRWGSLRDRYKRIKKQEFLPSFSGTSTSFSKKWKYYDALSFIPLTAASYTNIGKIEDEEATANTLIEFGEAHSSTMQQDAMKKSNDLTEYFSSFVEDARIAASKLPASGNPGDTTDVFFKYLAQRVKAANLGSIQRMQVEAAILNFTVTKLSEIQNHL